MVQEWSCYLSLKLHVPFEENIITDQRRSCDLNEGLGGNGLNERAPPEKRLLAS